MTELHPARQADRRRRGDRGGDAGDAQRDARPGPEVKAFEEEFSAHFGLGRACVAVNSGTSGLHLGLLAAGVGAGDEVIVPSFTFAATANSVALTGATPVFADIEPDTSASTPRRSRRRSPSAPWASCRYTSTGTRPTWTAAGRRETRTGCKLFEDAAQAHGASLNGTPVGAFGAFAMFSLYPTKNMTSGEGGMVSVADEEIERLMRLYRNQGMERQYHNEVVGLNNRMTDIHAAIGREQLKKVDAWTAQRQANAAFLSAHLEGSPRRRSPRARCTSTTSTPCASRRTGTAWPRRCARSTTSGRGCSTRCPTTGSSRSR
jgi:perosamine synthetase